ncbi:ROK family protein [Dactylosporangium roseum]|uniref:ROK family protein n=1 Tax=Dactylosporangium roseum TaxID=47989 RepID=A0ABY5YYL7_9ACTN|nr:ROK family protein [Dactylosporangium roseum]UWZ34327.1 ROK family protein [Dactylosporangium roseum]
MTSGNASGRRAWAAVDIGGTKIAAGLVDDTGRILERTRVATPAGARAVLDAVAGLVHDLCLHADRLGVTVRAAGVGAPGVIDPATATVRSATDILPGWAGTPVGDELRRRTGLPIAVANDVRVAAVGTAQDPAVAPHREVLHVSIGTGVGGALLRHGAAWPGPHASSGEVAHLLVPAHGAIPCGCGRRDHLEAVVAGPAIAAAYAERRAVDVLPLTEVVGRMRAGDRGADAVIRAAGRLLGRALAGLVAAVDVDAVTLGGGVALNVVEFTDEARAAFRAEALPPLRSVPVLVPATGADIALLGAARLARGAVAGHRRNDTASAGEHA